MEDEHMDVGYENLLTDLQDGVLQVTLNRPTKFNALNSATLDELLDVLLSAEEEDEIGAVILTGSPEAKKPAFVAGADIGEMAGQDVRDLRMFARRGQEVLNAIEGLYKPVIAAVNGLALGGGCELAMACHIRYASEDAVFGQPEINLGVIDHDTRC